MGVLVTAALGASMHFVREKEFCAFLGSTETATAVTPLATCCSNLSPSPSTSASTPPETPAPGCWGWAVSRAVDAAVRARALVHALVSRTALP